MTCTEQAPIPDRYFDEANLCPFPVTIEQALTASMRMPRLCVGHNDDGQACLLAQTAEAEGACRWVCAPSSDVAIQCLLAGGASPDDLFRHSLTGTIETIRVDFTGRLFESTRLCRDVGDDEYRFADAVMSSHHQRAGQPGTYHR
jgi:hypothetical protein